MTANVCIVCEEPTGLRQFPHSPITVDYGETCICADCYGHPADAPPFETLPLIGPLPVVLPRRECRETTPEA